MTRPDPLPAELRARATRQEWLVDTRQLAEVGLSRQQVSKLCTRGVLTRVAYGVYDLIPEDPDARTEDPSSARDDPLDHRRRRSAWLGMLTHGPDAVAVGQTALVLHGIQGLPKRPKVEIARADRRERRARDGVALRRYSGLDRLARVQGRLVVPVEQALAQAVPELGRRHAVACLDSAVHQRLISAEGVRRAHDAARGRRGVERTHSWWDLVDGRAESPAETWARLSCVDEGIPPDVLQQKFVVERDRIARVDMAWWLGPGRWLIAEIDGAKAHEGALVRDSQRQNPLVGAGNVIQRFTGLDAGSSTIGPSLKPLLAAAGWRPGRPVPRGPQLLPDVGGYRLSPKLAGIGDKL